MLEVFLLLVDKPKHGINSFTFFVWQNKISCHFKLKLAFFVCFLKLLSFENKKFPFFCFSGVIFNGTTKKEEEKHSDIKQLPFFSYSKDKSNDFFIPGFTGFQFFCCCYCCKLEYL